MSTVEGLPLLTPVQAGPISVPPSSKLIPTKDGVAYRWILSDAERAHIGDMLGVDGTTLNVTGNTMKQERGVCTGCGKYCGLDDLVHNALYFGVHSEAFMLDVMQNGPKGPSPSHEVFCSGCGQKHADPYDWTGEDFNWYHPPAY